jgi:NAD+ diphosphatase
VIDQDRVLVHGDPARLLLLGADVAPDGERYFLGVDADVDATPYFAVTGPIAVVEEAAADDIRPVAPRDVVHLLGRPDAELLMTAIALMNWHGRHGYSPATGHPTTAGDAGWTRAASDGETIWPRTDPAVIVLVHDGVAGAPGRCLLGHNAGWTAPGWNRRYSCLAGFVEPGEPAEASVCREVEEEVGVAVSGIRYVSSQAWPFPGSLMLGFLATADPAQPIRVDPTEISDARWFSRSEVTAILAGEPTDVRLPAPVSIAYYLLRWWLDER